MSGATLLFALLGSGVEGPAWVPPSGADAPPPGSSSAPKRPALDDPLAESIRPSGRLVGTVTVGPSGRDATTIADGYVQAIALRDAALRVDGKAIPSVVDAEAWARLRDYRVDVLIDPGVYPEVAQSDPIAASPHIGLYAADGKRSSVVCNTGFDPHTGWSYFEGIAVEPTGPERGKYPYHTNAAGTQIISRGRMVGADGGLGSGYPIGMDGQPNGFTVLYDCDFGAPGGVANLHGDLSYTDTPIETVCFVKCRYPGGALQYRALVDTAADEMWVVDSSADGVNCIGKSMNLHLSGSTIGKVVSEGTTDDRSDWPVPVGGLSPYWRSFLGL